jgi:hypothetical protein
MLRGVKAKAVRNAVQATLTIGQPQGSTSALGDI